MSEHWYVLHLNAEQWAIGPLDMGRNKGKLFPKIGPNPQLVGFQQAVKEALSWVEQLPEGQYALTFYVWRSRDIYEGANKRVRKSQVDATNIQKGLEDALQGVLFGNDRDVRDIRTVVVEQGVDVTPGIAICARNWYGFDPDELPQFVWQQLEPEDDPKSIPIWGAGDTNPYED